MLSVPSVLARALRLLLQHPVGVLWVLLQALLVSLFTLGIMAGPMQVGLFAVLLRYARDGVWAPQELWGKLTSHNLPAGVVFVAMQVALLLVGLPVANVSPLAGALLTFAGTVAIALLWFYTFQVLSDRDQPWAAAMRQGWNLMQRGGLGGHVLLVMLLNLLNLLPTDTVVLPVQILILLILLGFSTLAQTVAYAALVPARAPSLPEPRE